MTEKQADEVIQLLRDISAKLNVRVVPAPQPVPYYPPMAPTVKPTQPAWPNTGTICNAQKPEEDEGVKDGESTNLLRWLLSPKNEGVKDGETRT